MAKGDRKQNQNRETPDTYASEGTTYGSIVGVVFFLVFLITGHASYGAVLLIACVVVGLLIGLTKVKPRKSDDLSEDVRTYKKLDKQRNAFFSDTSVHTYDPNLKTPMIRKNLANGEKVAGFMNKATGKFEEKMLIRDEKDLKEFMRRYGIKGKDDIE